MPRLFLVPIALSLILWILAASLPTANAQETTAEQPQATSAAEQSVASEPLSDNSSLPAELLNPQISQDELVIRLAPLTKTDLASLAEAWLEFAKAKNEEVMQAQLDVMKSEEAAKDAARGRVTTLATERNVLFGKFESVLAAWRTKGGDEARIAEYSAYGGAVLVEETRASDFWTLLRRVRGWVTSAEGGLAVAWSLLVFAIWLYVLFIAGRIVRAFARRRIDRISDVSRLLKTFLVNGVYWLFLLVGLMMVLAILEVNITPLFALFGGATFIIGFAMQDTLSNLANGLMIMISRPFDEGDYVKLGSVAGTVKSVSIVATTITTFDNQVVVLPNKQVWGNVITNLTANDTRRVDLVFGIGYDDGIDQAIAVLNEVVAAHPLVLTSPRPTIAVGALADSSVNINCWPWVKTEDYWTVYWDLTHQVKERFGEAGISIPYPQQDVHLRVIRDQEPQQA